MKVHLIDGTYELFRHFYAVPSVKTAEGQEIGAALAVAGSILSMLERGATHVGIATDHVIESFRNELFSGYKTGEGVDPELRSQFELVEGLLSTLGFVVWPMVELEADDALASAAALAGEDARVGRVFICTPDKDLGQCVVGDRVVQLDRRTGALRDEEGVRRKFGVPPASLPDYLALVGDSADGIPGLPGWGARSAATLLGRYGHLEAIPKDAVEWAGEVRGAARLAETLRQWWDRALLFRRLATLRTDAEVFGSVDDLLWTGPRPGSRDLCVRLGRESLVRRAEALSAERGGASRGGGRA